MNSNEYYFTIETLLISVDSICNAFKENSPTKPYFLNTSGYFFATLHSSFNAMKKGKTATDSLDQFLFTRSLVHHVYDFNKSFLDSKPEEVNFYTLYLLYKTELTKELERIQIKHGHLLTLDNSESITKLTAQRQRQRQRDSLRLRPILTK